MIPRDPERLFPLLEASEAQRKKHRESVAAMIARYHGPWFKGTGPALEDEYDPANGAYQYISLMLSMLCWDNPRFTAKSKKPDGEIWAEAMRHAMDRIAVDTDAQEADEAATVDFLFSYGVLLTEMEPSPDQDPTEKDPRKRPVVNRLDPERFGLDPLCTNFRDSRIMFHTWVRDRDELLEHAREHPEEGWDVEALRHMSGDVGTEKLGRDKDDNAPQRDEIVGNQIWVPEWETPKAAAIKGKDRFKFNGTLVDVACAARTSWTGRAIYTGSKFIRRPRPFYGPAWGPYAMLGAYKVPGSPYPLGPLTATEGQSRELNAHKRAGLDSARNRKRILLGSDKDSTLVDTVLDTRDGEAAVVKMDNLDRNLREVEIGGMTEEQRLAILGLASDFDNALGMSDAKRGEVTGIGTATENAIADAAGNQRISWIKKRKRKGQMDAWRTAAWYVWNTEGVSVPMPAEFAQQTGMQDFKGGEPSDGQDFITIKPDITFEDLELEMEALSTERMDEGVAQARAMQIFNLAAQSMPVVGMFPMADWKQAFDAVGDAMNIPDLGTKLGVERVQAAAMQGQLPQQQADAAAAKPKMSGDSAAPKPAKSMARPGGAVNRPGPNAANRPQKQQGVKARMAGVSK